MQTPFVASPYGVKQQNIAHLYSQIQVAIDSAHRARTQSQPRHVPPSLALDSRSSTSSDPCSLSSSFSSPLTPKHAVLCACHQWLVSLDSSHCGLCDEPLPVMEHWHTLRQTQSKAIKDARGKIEELMKQQKQCTERIELMKTTHRDKEEAVCKCIDSMHSLQHDLKVLEQKYQCEQKQIVEIQESKENVKMEIEDLTVKLFEEATHMMKVEQKEKRILQVAYDSLEAQLKEAQDNLMTVVALLETVRQEIGDVEDDSEAVEENTKPNVIPLSSMTRAHYDLAQLHQLPLCSSIQDFKDENLLEEFEHFLGAILNVPLRRVYNEPFMKHCVREDVEPCLRFGPNPRLTAKKMMEAIQVKTCLVEECPPGFAEEEQTEAPATTSLWSRFGTTPFHGCGACGRSGGENRASILTYRFRISYFDTWTCIDRYCRDRLVSVIEFYSFLRSLRMGLYRERPIKEVYEECVRLRLQMFLSRMGSLGHYLQDIDVHPYAVGNPSLVVDSAQDDGCSSTNDSISTVLSATT
ncbi:hypothetical protein BDF14DRAFT_1775329 [Spinellus fusiger]|nr:hypothetical protein BDF14DRAFT_1775329 [Spinellus fusiger]